MDFYFRRVGFLATLAPYDGSYWRGVMLDDEARPAAEIKPPGPAPQASEPTAYDGPPRRCRVHQRRSSPPPLRACLLCRLAAAKA